MSTRILVVDDEPLYLRLVQANLVIEGYEVVTASNGLEALDIFSATSPNLVIMDIMMPKLDGLAACERIRQFSHVPIIMLTAKGQEEDLVRGLDMGADDYVVKPFSATELLARVRAVLRRSPTPEGVQKEQFFTHGDLTIDFARAEVSRNNKQVFLSATEYRLLLQFSQNVGQVMTPEQLLSAVWGPQYHEDKEILWVHIARLRQKLEENPRSPQHIVTRSGLGYIMPVLEDD
jgi:DNA-binding response OmpR family regulator